jgi:hypothetical protein
MEEQRIICPKCRTEIPLSQALIGPIEERLKREYETCLEDREKEVQRREEEIERSLREMDDNLKRSLEEERAKLKVDMQKEAQELYRLEMTDLQERLKEKECRLREVEQMELDIRKQQREIEERERTLEERVNKRLDEEKKRIKTDIRKETEETLGLELKDLQERLKEREEKLKLARDMELDIRKKQRELEERESSMEIEVQRRIDDQRKSIEEHLMERLQEQYHLKDLEKEKTINDLKEQIEIMKRKAEQGSQQLQGEVLELTIEEDLSRNFPFDDVVEVKKGQRGADVVQTVRTNTGMKCGTIIWETKRAKNWSNDWVPKLKDDMREAKADVAVLCTSALPKEISRFNITGDIVVTSTEYALAIAALLREQVIKLTRERSVSTGQSQKKDLLYTYLTGQEFRQSMEGVVEAFLDMKSDLDKEKASLNRIWSKREKQMVRALSNLGQMYGSMQGIAGSSLPRIDHLEMDQIPERTVNGDDPSLDDY